MVIVISAVICTYNRADRLALAIQSLIDQHMPKEQYEIIVIDNYSTDSTREVVEQFSHERNVRYVYEPELGLSYARNAGWRRARGKYVAYLDDDAIAGSDWLNKIVETFETVTPRPGCVGGKVDPIWEAPRPSWVSDELVTCLTVIDWSDKPQVLSDLNQKWLVGTNVAFPVEVLEQVGGFVSGLDRAGKNLLSGGDVFLTMQIKKAGYTCFYHPQIAVRHLTSKSRLNQSWFIRRYYWQGLSDAARQLIEWQPSKLGRLRLAASKVFSLLQSPGTVLNLILPSSKNPQRFTEKCFATITVGNIVGLLGAIRL